MLDAIINFWTLKNQHPLHMSQQGTFFIDKYIKQKCHIRMSTALASLSLLRQKHNTVTHACFLCYLQSRMITFFEYYLITAITIWPKVWINLTEYLFYSYQELLKKNFMSCLYQSKPAMNVQAMLKKSYRPTGTESTLCFCICSTVLRKHEKK